MNLDQMSDMTGMPSGKKTHRGKRSRGFGKADAQSGVGALPASAQKHLDNVNTAADAGNHSAVKSSAFHLVNALHAMSRPKGMGGAATDQKSTPLHGTDPSNGMPTGGSSLPITEPGY